jgi:hypothetical protein
VKKEGRRKHDARGRGVVTGTTLITGDEQSENYCPEGPHAMPDRPSSNGRLEARLRLWEVKKVS